MYCTFPAQLGILAWFALSLALSPISKLPHTETRSGVETPGMKGKGIRVRGRNAYQGNDTKYHFTSGVDNELPCS